MFQSINFRTVALFILSIVFQSATNLHQLNNFNTLSWPSEDILIERIFHMKNFLSKTFHQRKFTSKELSIKKTFHKKLSIKKLSIKNYPSKELYIKGTLHQRNFQSTEKFQSIELSHNYCKTLNAKHCPSCKQQNIP